MKFIVKVKQKAKFAKIEKRADGSFEVWVREPPAEGKANEAVAKVLAEFLGVSKSKVSLIIGAKSKQKIFELTEVNI